ncbi:Hypothetical predicted protein [Mytilus galloprovincialis]|uniref:Uncharacterized protein n=1 Tax=Mytilus galloprovincialis TaxID=29158 RepID=A0A8B6D6C9_MYTGA|nr:Hypothetical predicted protein [Mytilus galloprovincialis]
MQRTGMARLKYACDMDKSVLLNNFEARGWVPVSPDDDWNFYWAGVQSIRNVFSIDSGYRLTDDQPYFLLLNLPSSRNTSSLPADKVILLLIVGLTGGRSSRKILEKEGSPLAEKDENGRFIHLDFIPLTFMLPADYNLFVRRVQKEPQHNMDHEPCGKIIDAKPMGNEDRFTESVGKSFVAVLTLQKTPSPCKAN